MQISERALPFETRFERYQEEQHRAGENDDVHRRLDSLEHAEDLDRSDLDFDVEDHDREPDEPRRDHEEYGHAKQIVRRSDRARVLLHRLCHADELMAHRRKARAWKALTDPMLQPAQRLDDLVAIERLVGQEIPLSAGVRTSNSAHDCCASLTAQQIIGPGACCLWVIKSVYR